MSRHKHKNPRVKVYFRYKGRCFRLLEAINFGSKSSPELKIKGLTETLTQQQMAELFNTTRNKITLHIGNIFKEGELEVNSVRKESLLTAADGKKYGTKFYNLDVMSMPGDRPVI